MADEAAALRNKELQNAFSLVKSQFPRLNIPGLIIQQGKGEGFAEVFPADEARNPNFGRPTIEVRTGARGKFLSDLIATEATQILANSDPELQMLKGVFQRSLTSEQRGIASSRFEKRVKSGVEKRGFQDFMDQVQIDEFMRAILFPGLVKDKGFSVEKAFTSEQIAIAEVFKETLQSKGKK